MKGCIRSWKGKTMRLVVDANVVISALASSGVTRKVFLLWLSTTLFFLVILI